MGKNTIDFQTVDERKTLTHGSDAQIEFSVVLPCLNESDTLAVYIEKAKRGIAESNLRGEIIVADNGSTDGSPEIAEQIGARVVIVKEKGYGSALMGGIETARGEFVMMGDADDSYDFKEKPNYIAKLNEGYDLVMGCRLPSGGGKVLPGAMPLLHRWWGNPMFSWMARLWFGSPLNDVHCGMRAFRKDFYNEVDQRCTGMEFATEITIKASLYGYKVTEIPITLHPDGRTSHPPHLKTIRDGWRHLRLYLMYTPRWLFLLPGIMLILFGIVGYAVALPKLTIGSVTFDVHTLLFASLFLLSGFQILLFAFLTKVFAISEGLLPKDNRLEKLFEYFNLERGLIISGIGLLIGVLLLILAIYEWKIVGFGKLDYEKNDALRHSGRDTDDASRSINFFQFFCEHFGYEAKMNF